MECLKIGFLTFILICANDFGISSGSILSIEERPSNGQIKALEGSTLKLTCLVPTSQILDTIYWFVPSRDDMHVTNTNVERSPYIQIERTIPPRVMLFVRQFKSRDQGKYACRFYDRKDSSKRRVVAELTVQVSMVSDIRVVKADREQWLKDGATNALINCQLIGYPSPRIVWVRNSTVLRTDDKYSYKRNGLQLSTVTWSDAGKYVCRAVRSSTSKALDIFIDVRVFQKPTITMAPTVVFPMFLTADRDAYIDCKGDGKPKPKIFWIKQKTPNQLIQYVDPQRYFVNENTGRLRIFKVDFVKDTDTFICIAALTSSAIVNDVKDMMTRRSQNLQVYLWPSFFHTDRPLNPWVDRGKKATVVCSVRANGRVLMQFQKFRSPFPYANGIQPDDRRIKVTQTVDRAQPLQHYLTLEIDNTVTTDSSNYTCIATNVAGNSSVNGTINVEHRPEMYTNLTSQRLGWIRNGTNLTCIAFGLPFPSWSWYRHGIVPVLNGVNRTFHVFSYDYERSSQSWLQIKPDFGMERWIFDSYRCVATNRKGQGQRTVQFSPASVPGSPRLASLTVTSSSISIEVNPPLLDGGMTILYYLARYRAQGNAQRSWYGPVEFPVHYKVEFSGLMADTLYTFEIRARNLVGPSQTPLSVEKRTKPMSNPSKVIVISDPMSTYPYTYFLRWKVPHNGGEPLDSYRIRVRPKGSTGEWKEYRPLFNNPNLSGYFMVDLEADTTYVMNIQAHSVRGYSPDSYFEFKTPRADSRGKPDRVRGGSAIAQANGFVMAFISFALILRL